MKNAAVYNEAALSEGSERFYRGAKAGEATPSKGLVFSRDRADAAAYAAKIGGELSYVDVPNNRVAELKPAAHKPDARVIVSAEMAQGRRVAEPVQIAQAAPRQSAPTARTIAPPAEYRETPRVAGSERFYHGGKRDEQPSAKGMVFSRDAADAGRYAFKTGGQLSYIDVPKERMSEVQPSSKAPATRVVVSPALARERQAAPIVESKTLKAAPNEAAPAAAGESQESAGVKRSRKPSAPRAETEVARSEGAPTSDPLGKRTRTTKRADPSEAAGRAEAKKSVTEATTAPAKSGRMAALRDKQRAVEKQPRGHESGQEM
ncbi:MAG: hypothetical protein ACLPGW_15950 [Roseiarcus sp.]